jgi:hypothetical protein
MNPVLELCCLRNVSGLFEEKSSAGPHKIAVISIGNIKERRTLFISSGLNLTNIMI